MVVLFEEQVTVNRSRKADPLGPKQSEASGINRYGWVVGTVQNDSGQYRAFVRRPGQSTLTNLNNWTLASGETR